MRNMIDKIIYNLINTDYSFKSMLISYVIGIFSFNWIGEVVKRIILYVRKCIVWNKEKKLDKLYKKDSLSASFDYSVYCEIELFSSNLENGVDDENKIKVSSKDIVGKEYLNRINEYLFYYIREWEENNENKHIYGLGKIIKDKKVKFKIKDIIPMVDVRNNKIYGKFHIKTYETLDSSEIGVVKKEISNNIFDYFGESLEQTNLIINNNSYILKYIYDDDYKLVVKN